MASHGFQVVRRDFVHPLYDPFSRTKGQLVSDALQQADEFGTLAWDLSRSLLAT